MTFENLTKTLTADDEKALSQAGVLCDVKREDDVAYICFTLPRGGEAS